MWRHCSGLSHWCQWMSNSVSSWSCPKFSPSQLITFLTKLSEYEAMEGARAESGSRNTGFSAGLFYAAAGIYFLSGSFVMFFVGFLVCSRDSLNLASRSQSHIFSTSFVTYHSDSPKGISWAVCNQGFISSQMDFMRLLVNIMHIDRMPMIRKKTTKRLG